MAALAHNTKPKQASSMTYTGETNSKGERPGQGTAWLADLSTYTGEWKDDMPNGHGTMTYNDGKTYIGEWKDGERHGQGTGTWSKAISTPARCRTACSAAETPVRFPMAPSAPAIVRTATQLDGAPIMTL